MLSLGVICLLDLAEVMSGSDLVRWILQSLNRTII
jgi:hypothetical protein